MALGRADLSKMIPLHTHANIGSSFSRIVIKAHILYSKIGALQPEPVKGLYAFRELEHPTDNEMA